MLPYGNRQCVVLLFGNKSTGCDKGGDEEGGGLLLIEMSGRTLAVAIILLGEPTANLTGYGAYGEQEQSQGTNKLNRVWEYFGRLSGSGSDGDV